MISFLSTVDALFAASVVSAAAGVGSAVFLLARRQARRDVPVVALAAEAAQVEAVSAPQPATV